MYSDESTFCCLRLTRNRFRRPAGSDRFNSRYTVKTVKHLASLMVPAFFTGACGRVGIFFLPPNVTMNGERHQKVLEDHRLLFMAIHRSMHFLQDGPMPCLEEVKECLEDKAFQVIDWRGHDTRLVFFVLNLKKKSFFLLALFFISEVYPIFGGFLGIRSTFFHLNVLQPYF